MNAHSTQTTARSARDILPATSSPYDDNDNDNDNDNDDNDDDNDDNHTSTCSSWRFFLPKIFHLDDVFLFGDVPILSVSLLLFPSPPTASSR